MQVRLELNNGEFKLELSGEISKERLLDFIEKHWHEIPRSGNRRTTSVAL